MERDEVPPSVSRPYPLGERGDYAALLLGADRTVSAENPDDRLAAVAPSQPFRIASRGVGGEYPVVLPPAPPGRKKRDVYAALVRRVHHEVDVVPVVVVRSVLGQRNRRARVCERLEAVRIRRAHSVLLCDRDGLHDVEAEPRAVVEIPYGLLAVQAVEKLPRRVGEVEERLPLLRREEMSAVAHLEARKRGSRRLRNRRRQRGRAYNHPEVLHVGSPSAFSDSPPQRCP